MGTEPARRQQLLEAALDTPMYTASEQATGDSATDHCSELRALGTMGHGLSVCVPPPSARAAATLRHVRRCNSARSLRHSRQRTRGVRRHLAISE